MKTAEEWLKQLPPDILEHPMPLPVRLDYGLKIIRQIQLDAWKQGMSDAIKLAENTGISTDDLNGASRLQGVCNWFGKVKKAILEACDTKTIL